MAGRCGTQVLVVLLAVALAACGPSTAGGATPGAATADGASGRADDRLAGDLVVLAAASLTDALQEIGARFERDHPDVTVRLSFASSSQLAVQIGEGAPADVFVSAGPRPMERVADAGLLAGRPMRFAGNALTIAVEPGNPLGITGLGDLERRDVVVVLAAPDVPAGELAADVVAAAGLSLRPASLERDVRAALARVELGEADAAIVYETDVRAAEGAVDGVAIPVARNRGHRYTAAVVAGAANADAAAAFLEHLRSRDVQDRLRDLGFALP